MIFIVSVLMMLSFVLTGVMVNFGPNTAMISEKNITRDAVDNSQLNAIQWGDLLLRSKSWPMNGTTPKDVVLEDTLYSGVDSDGTLKAHSKISTILNQTQDNGFTYLNVDANKQTY